jgi:hypothetical protein
MLIEMLFVGRFLVVGRLVSIFRGGSKTHFFLIIDGFIHFWGAFLTQWRSSVGLGLERVGISG